MARDHELNSAARIFAANLKTLLNSTVCNGAHIGAILAPAGRAVVATRPDRHRLDSRPVQLITPASGEPCWLNVSFRLYLDDRGYLTADSSTYAVHVGPDADEFFHYDYERDKDAYTEAHLQVVGECGPLSRLMAAIGKPKRTLSHLHFPVGGRRFRPSLEDVLEALINEGIVTPADGWRSVLDESRDSFREKQLKAMIARKPEVAAEALRACGYDVARPETEGGNVLDFIGRRRRKRNR